MKKFSSQQKAWEQEYQNPALLSLSNDPGKEVMNLCKWLKKEGTVHLGFNLLQDPEKSKNLTCLDLGCGNGRNLNFLAENYGATGLGVDFSQTAIKAAQQYATLQNISDVKFEVDSIGEKSAYREVEDSSCKIILDMTASNALYDGERETYLGEVGRTLHDEGIFVVRALCLDGDRNAKKLVKMFPGPESNTYYLPDIGVIEKVFTEGEFKERYEKHFNIVHFAKPSGYQRWGNQSFRRRYIVAYMTKK